MVSYTEYYKSKNALENLLPDKRDIEQDDLPLVVASKAAELRLLILGALAELDGIGWDDDD